MYSGTHMNLFHTQDTLSARFVGDFNDEGVSLQTEYRWSEVGTKKKGHRPPMSIVSYMFDDCDTFGLQPLPPSNNVTPVSYTHSYTHVGSFEGCSWDL